jgi:hypothetical protein
VTRIVGVAYYAPRLHSHERIGDADAVDVPVVALQHGRVALDEQTGERLAMPQWHILRNLVLLTLRGQREPVRRYALVEHAIAARPWPAQLRDQKPLATNPTHRTHLGERVDATVGRLYADGLLERPRRGWYTLSAKGRREAHKLTAGATPPGGGTQTHPPGGAAAKPAGDGKNSGAATGQGLGLPSWAAALPVGRWRPYVPRHGLTTRPPEPFSWLADEKDAQTQQHADVLNRLYAVLARAGIAPVEGTRPPACDLMFRSRAGGLTVVEAKSLPTGADEHQMRLGVGQVLEYRRKLADRIDMEVRAILAVPRAPRDAATWRRVCEDAGVTLLVAGPATRGLRAALLRHPPQSEDALR